MLVADSYLGHRDDPAVDDRLAGADAHRVVLSDVERQRSRVRTETEAGRDLGVVVARDLADGDVLETEDGALVVVELAAVEAVAVRVADCEPSTAIELGHALGNRHLDLALRDGDALIPTDGDRATVESVLESVLPDATTRDTGVSPSTFDDGPEPDHSHDDGQGHSHSHENSHDHGHGQDHNHAGDPLAGPRTPDESHTADGGGDS